MTMDDVAAGGLDPLQGFADLHNHQFANLGFGGVVIHGSAFGDPSEALDDCRHLHGRHGWRDVEGNFVRAYYSRNIGSALGHRNAGFPRFTGWPAWNSASHQSMHQLSLKRAVDGGLRLMVMLAVNNERLAQSKGADPVAASDESAIVAQLEAARAMQDRVDGECGGPGMGWYRIVEHPAAAEEVIRSGRLAVVLGVEVDYLLHTADLPPTTRDIEERLDRLVALGARHFFPVHLADNEFGGTAFSNPTVRDRGARWPSKRNPLLTDLKANRIDTEPADAYEYRTGRRNVRRLTPLGRHLIRCMIDRQLIIDVDHMGVLTRRDVLAMCAERGYPVVAGHTGFAEIGRGARRSEGQLLSREVRQIADLGGMFAPLLCQCTRHSEIREWSYGDTEIPHRVGASTESWIQAYLYALDADDGAPVAMGTDFNGFAGLPRPRFSRRSSRSPGVGSVSYPIAAALAGGGSFDRHRLGERVFDINVDGVADVGMLVDVLAECRAVGLTTGDLAPLMRSAAAYVDLWRRL